MEYYQNAFVTIEIMEILLMIGIQKQNISWLSHYAFSVLQMFSIRHFAEITLLESHKSQRIKWKTAPSIYPRVWQASWFPHWPLVAKISHITQYPIRQVASQFWRSLKLMVLFTNLTNTKWCKHLKNDWNPGICFLKWECSARAIHWIPTWQGLYALDKSSLSTVKGLICTFFYTWSTQNDCCFLVLQCFLSKVSIKTRYSIVTAPILHSWVSVKCLSFKRRLVKNNQTARSFYNMTISTLHLWIIVSLPYLHFLVKLSINTFMTLLNVKQLSCKHDKCHTLIFLILSTAWINENA